MNENEGIEIEEEEYSIEDSPFKPKVKLCSFNILYFSNKHFRMSMRATAM